ncbi:MAG: hypothetical protein C0524_05445 [Rhodobacter sp.]|nr:hypothetical protein [Rhodobacter sp.]
MTSESKILTVSYGTFSCTLEGFDDPFNAMKAIAEYFRDLAADDRYFGAEPPQPDAAMLHRIAEREVSRLVDSRVRDNGVYLRPQEAHSAKAPAEPGSEKPYRTTGKLRDSAEAGSWSATADASAPVDAGSVEPSLQDVIPNGVAAKLARIRQSVNPPSITARLPQDVFQDYSAGPESAGPDTEGSADDLDDLGTVAGSDVLSGLDALLQSPDEPLDLQALAEDEATSDEGAEEDVTDDELADQSEVAAASDTEEDALTDEAAFLDADEAEAAFIEATAKAELELTPEPEAEADTPEEIAEDEAAEEVLADMSADIAEVETLVEPEVTPVTGSIFADSLPEDEPEVVASLTEALVEDPTPEVAEADEPVGAEPESASTGKGNGKSKNANSRVVRLRPGDDDTETRDPNATRILKYSGEDAEVARLLRQADDVMADVDNRRRLDAIAHLKAAVVATEAERAVTGDTKSSASTKLDPYRDDLAHVVQPDTDEKPGKDAEVRPRRSTVSARPQEPRPGTIRPGMVSPPPLVLVSEQRIDRVAPAQTPGGAPPREGQPMIALRTGRLTGAIGAGASLATPSAPPPKIMLEKPYQGSASDLEEDDDLDEDLTEDDEAGLANFAERVGVKSMAEMLEAAAAYATCIEKRSQFTRPQLMRRLMASAGGRPVSREDGLRSFGTLLRTGRIEKVGRGNYTLAESSPYLAEARRYS